MNVHWSNEILIILLFLGIAFFKSERAVAAATVARSFGAMGTDVSAIAENVAAWIGSFGTLGPSGIGRSAMGACLIEL